MKIGIIAATGKAGSLIAKEAYDRGMDVTAIVRNKSKVDTDKYAVMKRDIFDITADDVRNFDAVVNAFGAPPGKEIMHQTTLKHLTEVFEQVPGVRFLMVGGAASLYTDETETRQVIEMIPEEWRPGPASMLIAFNELKKSKVNWTFLSPAYFFDSEGPRTGRYKLGTDYLFNNRGGESYLSYADAAVAIVDEIEKKKFAHGKRFTAVSERA